MLAATANAALLLGAFLSVEPRELGGQLWAGQADGVMAHFAEAAAVGVLFTFVIGLVGMAASTWVEKKSAGPHNGNGPSGAGLTWAYLLATTATAALLFIEGIGLAYAAQHAGLVVIIPVIIAFALTMVGGFCLIASMGCRDPVEVGHWRRNALMAHLLPFFVASVTAVWYLGPAIAKGTYTLQSPNGYTPVTDPLPPFSLALLLLSVVLAIAVLRRELVAQRPGSEAKPSVADRG